MGLTRLTPNQCYLIAALGGVPIGVLAVMPHGSVVMNLVAVPAVAWVLFWSVVCWRIIDEPAREAQKAAWFWGGGLALILAVLVILLEPGPLKGLVDPLVARTGDRGPYLAFTLGIAFVGALQVLGFLVAWSGWWIVKRRP